MAFFTWINATNSLIQAKHLDKCKNGFYHQMTCSMAFHITLQLRAYVDSAIRLFTNPGASFIYLHHYSLILLTGVSIHPSKSTPCSPHVSLPWEADLNGDGHGFPILCLRGEGGGVQPMGSQEECRGSQVRVFTTLIPSARSCFLWADGLLVTKQLLCNLPLFWVCWLLLRLPLILGGDSSTAAGPGFLYSPSS